MFGHLATSSLADAVVTRRQLLPPNPSVRPRLALFGPHQEGRFPPPAAGPVSAPDPELPQPVRSSAAMLSPATLRTYLLDKRMCVSLLRDPGLPGLGGFGETRTSRDARMPLTWSGELLS